MEERNIKREVDLIIDSSKITTTHHYAACTIVLVKLPNDVVLVQTYIKQRDEVFDAYRGFNECMSVIRSSVEHMIRHKEISVY